MAEVELPAFTEIQKESSDRFVALMGGEIMRNGAIPFSDFMHRSLYEPGLGYYVNGLSKLGKHGDFTTAPETSEHLAVCIANQCKQVFDAIGPAEILEFGSGSGRLAVDLLKALEKHDCLPLSYLILDVSSELQQEQQQLLQTELPENVHRRVQWLQGLPESFSGVVLANEVLDAFAVERFRIVNNSAERVMVGYNDNGFYLHTVKNEFVQTQVLEIENDIGRSFTEGYESVTTDLIGATTTQTANQPALCVVFIGTRCTMIRLRDQQCRISPLMSILPVSQLLRPKRIWSYKGTHRYPSLCCRLIFWITIRTRCGCWMPDHR